MTRYQLEAVSCVLELRMRHDLKYHPVSGLNGRMVYIFKLASGSLQHSGEAEEIAARAKSSLRAGDYAPDIVVMEGEPTENPNLFGSYSAIAYIRSLLPTLGADIWHPAVLD
jgi:hypothetical protein